MYVICDCETDSTTEKNRTWRRDKFALQIVRKYKYTPKLQKIIKTKSPKVILSPLHINATKKIYSVAYIIDKPSKVQEGSGFYFDVIRIKDEFKLKSVWEIP